MSQNYRIYDDRWCIDRRVKDELVDVSLTFDVNRNMMDEIAQAIDSVPAGRQEMERVITSEMADVVFGSNQIEGLGADLDETLR